MATSENKMKSATRPGNVKYKPEIDVEKCMGCGLCMDSCESHAVKGCLILKNGNMCVIDEASCLAAQPRCEYRCEQLCPNRAFKLKKV
nr:4Fe-4S binding protein [Candidatus Sigynarchaeota archaeon]